MRSQLRMSALAPWAGLIAAPAAWGAHHQLASTVIYMDCQVGGPLLTAGLGLLFAAVAVAGGLVSWRSRRAAPASPDRPDTRTFAAWLSLGAVGLFLAAILFQSLAGVLLKACQG